MLICGFVGRDIKQISNIKCVSVVATENIYLLSFVALFLIMLRAAYLVYQYFSLHFSFFKKGLHRECNGIFEINIIFFTDWIRRGFY